MLFLSELLAKNFVRNFCVAEGYTGLWRVLIFAITN